MDNRDAGEGPRVLILIATRILGGPGKNLLQFLQAVDGKVEYVLATFVRRAKGPGEFIRVAEERGISPTRLDEAFLFDPRTVLQAAKLARAGRVNLIQTHGYKSHMLGFLLSRVLGIPWVAYAHGWTRENRKAEVYNRLDRWLLQRADTAVAVSPALQNELRRLRGTRPTELILNAVDPTEIRVEQGGAETRRRLGVGPQQILLGAVGRLSSEKGQDVLIRAFSRLLKHFPDARLVLVGDGPELASWQGLARALGAEGQIHFVGHQEAPGDFYQAMDLLVLPSYSEGLPNAVLEAMALGTPVVATKVGGVGEIISHGENGWLVSPGSEDEMTHQIQSILQSPELLVDVGRRAPQSLYPKFHPDERAGRIRQVYAKTLSQGRSSTVLGEWR